MLGDMLFNIYKHLSKDQVCLVAPSSGHTM